LSKRRLPIGCGLGRPVAPAETNLSLSAVPGFLGPCPSSLLLCLPFSGPCPTWAPASGDRVGGVQLAGPGLREGQAEGRDRILREPKEVGPELELPGGWWDSSRPALPGRAVYSAYSAQDAPSTLPGLRPWTLSTGLLHLYPASSCPRGALPGALCYLPWAVLLSHSLNGTCSKKPWPTHSSPAG
jgi:hypothetical protein